MFGKINCTNILKDHTSTLRRQDSDGVRFSDIVLFYISPGIISGIVLCLDSEISEGLVTLLITSLSIFAALLFNLLLLVHGAICRKDLARVPNRINYIKEIFNNISFAILSSVIAIVFLLVYSQFINTNVLETIFSFVIYYLVILFILTLFMVLKRIHILLKEETKYYSKE